MTDEEKAEEYAIKITDELRNKGFLTNEEIDQRYAGIVQGVLYGFAEGRKETFSEEVIKNLKENTSVINSVIINKLSEKCEQLEKENAGLKKNLDRYSQKIAEQEETIDAQDDKINFYVAKMNENILKRQELEKENKISEEIIIGEQQEINELKKEISVLLSCANCQENKGGYVCEKEYNDKCLAQKIEFIKELKEENEELKEQNKSLIETLCAIATDTNEHITHNIAQNELDKWEMAE